MESKNDDIQACSLVRWLLTSLLFGHMVIGHMARHYFTQRKKVDQLNHIIICESFELILEIDMLA